MKRIRSQRVLVVCAAVVVLLALSGVGAYSAATGFSSADLVTQLRAHGAAVEQVAGSPGAFFGGTGQRITVNGEHVEVYEYGLPLAADLDARHASADCSTFTGVGTAQMVDWIAPPHCYKRGRVIVMYIGSDATVTHLLTAVLGVAFAGRT